MPDAAAQTVRSAALLAVSLLVVLRLARSISRPVKRVTDRMVALSDGDLHTEVLHIDTGDELEVMTQTLDATLESMNRYISDIQQVLTRVAGGDLRTGPQVDYKGDFVLIRGSLCTITESMNLRASPGGRSTGPGAGPPAGKPPEPLWSPERTRASPC